MEQKTWLTIGEAAESLGVTDRSIRNFIARGALPASRIRGGRAIRIRAEDVAAMLVPIPTVGGGDAA